MQDEGAILCVIITAASAAGVRRILSLPLPPSPRWLALALSRVRSLAPSSVSGSRRILVVPLARTPTLSLVFSCTLILTLTPVCRTAKACCLPDSLTVARRPRKYVFALRVNLREELSWQSLPGGSRLRRVSLRAPHAQPPCPIAVRPHMRQRGAQVEVEGQVWEATRHDLRSIAEDEQQMVACVPDRSVVERASRVCRACRHLCEEW